ncbi:hypothetical protein [Limosilactobacillus mucosae]|uniref:hypothetical protein n=1 Tax=Limosilactobacillus mucosae TaxID=97478 RepID=UPI000FFB8CCA|nr:hypothetical protein [Limosilactobacillus mucosae]RXA58185.1 hypothetical protein EQ839_03055 [Limosilactobacillus mucosae]
MLIFTIISALICFGTYKLDVHLADTSASAKTEQNSSDHYCLIGHKIIKSRVKSQEDGLYYTDKVDPNIRYFVDDSHKVTAIKYMYEPNHKPGHSAVIELSALLNDKHLKFTNDKQSDNDFYPSSSDKTFNVYSPKYKKWYHATLQFDGKDKVSQFSVWEGKSDDAE